MDNFDRLPDDLAAQITLGLNGLDVTRLYATSRYAAGLELAPAMLVIAATLTLCTLDPSGRSSSYSKFYGVVLKPMRCAGVRLDPGCATMLFEVPYPCLSQQQKWYAQEYLMRNHESASQTV